MLRLAPLALLLIGCSEYDLSNSSGYLGTGDNPLGTDGSGVPEGPSGGISGRICAPNEATWISGAEVWVKHDWGRSETFTDGDGRFLLEGLPPGTHKVHADKGNFSTTFMMEVFVGEITELASYECVDQGDVTIAVVTGQYDDIGQIIHNLELDYDRVEGVNNTTYVDFLRDPDWLAEYDMIFFNCGMGFDWMDHQAEVTSNLREYVQNGGSVYASDWAYYLVEATWPAQQRFHGDDSILGEAFVGIEGEVTADVYDPSMAALLGGDTARINYDLGAWVGLESTQGEVLIEGRYDYSDGLFGGGSRTAPLAYRMTDGGGTVLYTTFHNEQQTTVDMGLILQEIILSL